MDPTHAILFEPVKIGPVTAPNRFYQTPHATGFGWQRPQAGAALRGVKSASTASSAAQNAAGGMTISEGTGMIELSIAMSRKTPAYPQASTHPNQVLTSS